MSPRLSHAVGLAALIQCLWRLRTKNLHWRRYDSFLVQENRWRAQRYGTSKGLIDFGRGEIVPSPELLDELIDLVTKDVEALNGAVPIAQLRSILSGGNSSDRQHAVYAATIGDTSTKMNDIVNHLIAEFSTDL